MEAHGGRSLECEVLMVIDGDGGNSGSLVRANWGPPGNI